MKISVIVPSWEDAESVQLLLPKLDSVDEVIVVEASATGNFTSQYDAKFLRCTTPTRGGQMNLGAASATGDVLVFLHADTAIEPLHVEAIRQVMPHPMIVGGAFYRRFDSRHPHLRWLEGFARFLTRHGGTLFGDQTVFVRRAIFERLGGFAEIPLMEDVEFSRRLRAAGKVAILDPPIGTSPRYHLENGAWRSTIRNGLFLLLFKLGVSARTLHSIYYSRRHQTNAPPQLEPAPAVQPKQCDPVRISRFSTSAGSMSQSKSG